jgi:acyl carrier protein
MKERIREVIAEVIGASPEEIPIDAHQETVSGWNSIRHMNLVIALEKEFQVRFSDLHIAEMMSIALIEDTIVELRGR